LPVWATRVHAAAARARQNEFADMLPEEHWDQRSSESPAPPAARPTRLASRAGPASSARPAALARPGSAPRPASSARPAPAHEGRVVDYSAFDDVGSQPVASRSGGGSLARGTRVFHRRFGSGIVEQCEGPDKVVARFKGFGQKKVLLEYLTLKE
jgi:hypothetical protein